MLLLLFIWAQVSVKANMVALRYRDLNTMKRSWNWNQIKENRVRKKETDLQVDKRLLPVSKDNLQVNRSRLAVGKGYLQAGRNRVARHQEKIQVKKIEK